MFPGFIGSIGWKVVPAQPIANGKASRPVPKYDLNKFTNEPNTPIPSLFSLYDWELNNSSDDPLSLRVALAFFLVAEMAARIFWFLASILELILIS